MSSKLLVALAIWSASASWNVAVAQLREAFIIPPAESFKLGRPDVQQKLEAYYTPEHFSNGLAQASAALYSIVTQVDLEGKFVDAETQAVDTSLSRLFYGNAFAVDDQGNLMTNWHLVGPDEALRGVLERLAQGFQDPRLGKKIRIKAISQVRVSYTVRSAAGEMFSSCYDVQVSFPDGRKKIRSNDWSDFEFTAALVESSAHSGSVTILGLDPSADLAVINIPIQENAFLPFGKTSSLALGDDVYGFALRPKFLGQGFWGELEIRWGFLSNHCDWITVNQSHNVMVSEFLIISHTGNSGGPLLSETGEVVAVFESLVLSQDENAPLKTFENKAYGVPATYAQAFYQHVVDPAAHPKPTLSCDTCIEQSQR